MSQILDDEALDEEIRTLRTHYWSARDPDGRAFAPLAEAYRRKGELEEAGALVRDGIDRLPGYATGHLVAARVCRDRGADLEAREHLDRVLELDPENVIALLERAELVRAEGDREQALADLQTLLELEPGHSGALAALEEIEEIDETTVWRPDQEVAFDLPESEPASDAEDLEEVLGDFDLEIEEEPQEEPEFEPEGEMEPEGGFEEEPEFEPEAELEPEGEFEQEGEVEKEGEFEPEAELEPEGEIEEEDPDDESTADRSMYTRTMGEIYARQGLVERAVEIYSDLLEHAPDDEDLALRLEELRARLGSAGRARSSSREPAAAGGGTIGSATGPARAEPETSEEEVAAAPPAPTGELVSPPADQPSAEKPSTEHARTEHARTEQAPSEQPSDGAAGRTRSIGDYLEDLLAWVPGAVPVESLAPNAVPIEALAPDAVPVDELAPEPVEVDSLAPDGAAEKLDQDDGDDDDFDEFQSWLESLRT